MKLKLISSTSFLLSGAALAQGIFNSLPSEPEITQTGTRMPMQTAGLASDVRIIKRAAIASATEQSLQEILQRRAGVMFVRSAGSSDAVAFLRGSNSNQVLLLIDGMRANAVATGQANWSNIALANIERIEVLQGPATAIYGADAVGGVVQVFTRKNILGATQELSVSASSQFKQASASLAGGDPGGVYYNLGISHSLDRRPTGAATASAASDAIRRDPSERQTTVNAGISIRINDNWAAGATLVRAARKLDYVEGLSQQRANQEQNTEVAKIFAQVRPSPTWTSKLTLSQTKETDDVVSPRNASQTTGTRKVQTFENHFLIPNGHLTLGAERSNESLQSGGANQLIFAAAPVRDTSSIFAAYQAQVDNSQVQISARQDKTSEFEKQQNVSVGYSVQSDANTRFFSSYSTAYTLPSMRQKFATVYANAQLLPEKSNHTELGVEWQDDTRFGKSSAKAVVYRNQIDNKIIAPTNYVPTNIDKAKVQGYSLAYKTKTGPLEFSAQYDRVNAQDLATGKALPRTAKHNLSANVDYRQGPWRVGAEVLRQGEQTDLYFNETTKQPTEVTLDAATLLNLSAQYDLETDWNMQFKINNVTNRSQQSVLGTTQNPRAYYLVLRYQPQNK